MVIFLGKSVIGSKIVNFTEKLLIMADNYLEKRYDEYVARKEAEQKARQRAWKKRLDAYRKYKCFAFLRRIKKTAGGCAAVCGSGDFP